MKILIAGATGLIGKLLVQNWKNKHELHLLGREKQKLLALFPEHNHLIWPELAELDAKQFDVVINLCGKNIGEGRWTEGVKRELIESRVQTNKNLSNWLIRQQAKPRFFSASAIGIYGMQKIDDKSSFTELSSLDDQSPPDFISEIGMQWEQALKPAIEAGIPVIFTRFGVVLKKNEGMLKKLAPVFKLGLGSVIGSGEQILSWISAKDLVNAYDFLLESSWLTGPINLTSPEPVTQKQFAQTLATLLRRPLLLKTPSFVINLLFGEMGTSLLLNGQRVMPSKLIDNGFQFTYPTLSDALQAEFASS